MALEPDAAGGGPTLTGGPLGRIGEVVLCGVEGRRVGVVERLVEVDDLRWAGLLAGQTHKALVWSE